MKPTTYALIVALTVGAAPVFSATAQQEIGRHTSKQSINQVPVSLAPIRVVATSEKTNIMQSDAAINNVPVRLPPVHIVASRQGGKQQQLQEEKIVPSQHIVVLRVAISFTSLDSTSK